MNKVAFITGISGQDGAYLAKLLLQKGYKVIGGDRRTSDPSLWRLDELDIRKDIKILDFDLLEISNMRKIIENNNISEIYNLGAQSFVAASFNLPIYTSQVNSLGLLNILEIVRDINPSIKVYQASTSEMFGKVLESPQNEKTPFYPRSPYAISKLFSHWSIINYREAYNMFACSGICFNHESPYRGEEFVTKKIIKSFKDIYLGNQDYMTLGNLDAKRDWGFAGDYVEAMWLMMNNRKPADYVIATGETHTVRDFILESAKYFDFDIVFEGDGENEVAVDKKTNKIIIQISKEFYRPTEVDVLIGDYSKIKKELAWSPKINFKQLVKIMAEYELKK